MKIQARKIVVGLIFLTAVVGIVAVFNYNHHMALAQGTTSSETNLGYTPLEPLPGGEQDTGTLAGYLNRMFAIFIGLASIMAVLMITIGGFRYLTSGDSESARTDAKKKITEAILGLLIALSAVLVLETINPDLLDFSLKLRNIQQGSVGSGTIPPRPPAIPPQPPDGRLDFDPGIAAQVSHASDELKNVLTCMANTLPGNTGRVSSISDSAIIDGVLTFEQCSEGGQSIGCAHRIFSCHYGGTNCTGKSYAVDFGDEENALAIADAARLCDNSASILHEGDHIHITISAARVNECGC